jgi:hypothetical protein
MVGTTAFFILILAYMRKGLSGGMGDLFNFGKSKVKEFGGE